MPRRSRTRHNSTFSKAWSWFIRGPWQIILSILAGIVAVSTYFNEITDFVNNLRENIGTLLTITIATSLVIVVIALWYLITHKKNLTKRTKAFILGISTVVLLSSLSFGLYSYNIRKAREQKFVIAIADFYTTNEKDYGVTEDISYKLSQLLANENNVVVEQLNIPITEAEGREEAVRQGEVIDADIVFWGWYTVTQTNVLVTIHIEDLTSVSMPENTDYGLPESYQIHEDVFKIDTFELQKDISEDFSGIAFFLLGKAAVDSGKFNEAIEYYTETLERETYIDKWYFYSVRGYTYLAYVKDLENATTDLELAIATMPTNSPKASSVYNSLGTAYFYAKDFGKAEEIHSHALELELNKETPDELMLAILLSNIGSDIAELGRCEDSLDYFSRALVYADDKKIRGLSYLDRGLCYSRLGRDKEALPDFNEAINILRIIKETDIKKPLRQAYFNRAQTYEQMGDNSSLSSETKAHYKNAISDYTVAVDVDINYQLGYWGRGQLFWKLKEFDKAENDLKQAAMLGPNDSNPHLFLSAVYYDQGLFSRALEELNIVSRIDSITIADAYRDRALIYLAIAKSDENVLNDCTQAILLDPSIKECYFLRGSTYFRLWSISTNPFDYLEYKNMALEDLTLYMQIGEDSETLETTQAMIDLMNDY